MKNFDNGNFIITQKGNDKQECVPTPKPLRPEHFNKAPSAIKAMYYNWVDQVTEFAKDPFSPISTHTSLSLSRRFNALSVQNKLLFCYIITSAPGCPLNYTDDEMASIGNHIYSPDHAVEARYKRELPESSACHMHFQEGWLSYDWSLARVLYGNIDAKDAQKLAKSICDNQVALIKLSEEMNDRLEQAVTASTTSINELFDNTESIAGRLNEFIDSNNDWTRHVKEEFTKVGDSLSHQDYMNQLFQLINQLRTFIDQTTDLYLNLLTYEGVARDLVNHVMNKQVPATSLIDNDLSPVIRAINKASPEQFQVVPTKPPHDLFHNLKPTCTYGAGTLLFIFDIPLINTYYDFSTWRIFHVPMFLGSVWVEVDAQVDAVMIDLSQQTFTSFTPESLALCEQHPLRLCPVTPPLQTFNDTNCLVDIIRNSPEQLESCHLKALPMSLQSESYALPIQDNAWLVTTKTPRSIAGKYCKMYSGLEVEETQSVGLMQIITVPPQCVIRIGSLNLQPQSINHDFYQISSNTTLNDSTVLLNDVIIRPITPLWSTLQTANYTNFSLPIAVEKLINFNAPSGLISLKSLQTKLKNNSFRSVVESIYAKRDEIPSNDPIPPEPLFGGLFGWLTIGDIVNYFLHAIVIIPLAVKLIYRFYSRMSPTGRVMSAGIPLMEMASRSSSIPTSFAAPLKKIYIPPKFPSVLPVITTTMRAITGNDTSLSSNMTTVVPTTTNLSNPVMITSNTTELLSVMKVMDTDMVSNILTSTWTNALIIMLMTLSVSISVAVICHLITVNHLNLSFKRMFASLGGLPQNLTFAHHVYETKVIMTVCVAIGRGIDASTYYANLTDKQVVRQLSFQISTLPGSAVDWAVIQTQDSLLGFIEPLVNARWWRRFYMKIKWGSLCIRRKPTLLTSACESLPTDIQLHMNDVRAQLGDTLPAWWTHLKVISLIAINFVDVTSNIDAYTSGSESEGNIMAKRLRLDVRELA